MTPGSFDIELLAPPRLASSRDPHPLKTPRAGCGSPGDATKYRIELQNAKPTNLGRPATSRASSGQFRDSRGNHTTHPCRPTSLLLTKTGFSGTCLPRLHQKAETVCGCAFFPRLPRARCPRVEGSIHGMGATERW